MSELLDRDQIVAYLNEVAEILGETGPLQVVIVVGGALLAHYHLRDSTRDVDSVRQLDDELAAAVAEVAARHDLGPEWLNARAATFRPGTLDEDGCDTILEHGRLRVLAAPLDQVFLMKLYAARSTDYSDLVRARPHTGFPSAQEAVDAYWEAYPAAPSDEFLLGFVEGIISETS